MSTQIHFRKTQLAIALTAALTAGGAFAEVTSDAFNPDAGVPGAQVTGGDFTVGDTKVTPGGGSGSGDPGVLPTIDDNGDGTSTVFTVTDIGAYTDVTETKSGYALIDTTGSLTLTGGQETIETTTFDLATSFLVDNATGLPIGAPTIDVTGSFDPDTGIFTPGPGTTDTTVTTADGGNLTMSGLATIGNGLKVTSLMDDPANGFMTGPNPGVVNVLYESAEIGVINDGGHLNGLSATKTQTVISGGTKTTTVSVDDSGVTVTDSTNGQTFALDNVGNVGIAGGLTSNGITNTGGMTNSGGLTNTGGLSTDTLTTSGLATLASLQVNGASTTNGITNTGNIATDTLSTTGDASIGGNASVAGTLGVTGATTTNGITNTGNIATDTLSTTGDASIGDDLTVGGSLGVTGDTTLAGTLGVTGATTLGNTLTVAGGTTLNGATQVNNTLGVTGATTLGNTLTVAGATTLNGATTVNNTLNVTGATTTASITNNGTLTNNGNAVFTGSGGTRAVQINSGTSTRALDVNGAMHLNANSGNTTLYADANGVNATGNGANLVVNGTNAQLTNSIGKGMVVSNTQTQIGGGTASTYLTLNNSGATFSSNSNSTVPVRVTGVADGVNQYDAVNYGQVQSAYSSLKRDISDVEDKANAGVAAAVALAGIPAPAAGKQYTVGIGWGNYESENAFALGGRAQITPEFQLTAGWGYSNEGNAFNVGAGYSW